MDLWYSEKYTKDVKFSMRINEHLYTCQSDYQRIDVMESYELEKSVNFRWGYYAN